MLGLKPLEFFDPAPYLGEIWILWEKDIQKVSLDASRKVAVIQGRRRLNQVPKVAKRYSTNR